MSFQVSGAVCGEMLVTVAIGAAMSGGDVDQFAVLTFATMAAGLLLCVGLTYALRVAVALVPPSRDAELVDHNEEEETLIAPG